MNTCSVNIARYLIRFDSENDLSLSSRFRNFVQEEPGEPDLNIRVYSGNYDLPSDAECVFRAPYVEEIDGMRFHRNPEFWSVWKHGDQLYMKTIFPESSGYESAVLKFSFLTKEWDLLIKSNNLPVDPLGYPLDGLILYYLTVINRDIMIHASGVNHEGKGYLFSGVSGQGKTTMAKIWQKAGSKIVHDDRLIINSNGNDFLMHSTPVNENDEAGYSPIHAIYLISHGTENRSVRITGAEAVSRVMANCIHQAWGREIISGLLESVSTMCSNVPVYKLSFLPGLKIIDEILNNGK